MYSFTVDGTQIEKWGGFSGDRNPIHFDPQAARQLGATDVVAHGMIPMMITQEQVYQELLRATPSSPWRQCKIRLRRPLQKDRQVQPQTKPAGAGLRFNLATTDGSEQYFLGTFENLAAQPDGAEDATGGPRLELTSFSLSAQESQEREAALLRLFPELHSRWLRFGALVFSEFLKRNMGVLQGVAGQMGSPGQVVAVQTTYTVAFNEPHFSGSASSVYLCDFSPARIFTLEDGSTTECRCQVSTAGSRVLELGIGMLVKSVRPQA